MAADDTTVTTRGTLDAQELATVTALVEDATEADGVRPLSEHVALHLRHGGEGPDRNLLAWDGAGRLVGYAHLDPTDAVEGPSAELVVAPSARRRGAARALVEALEAEVGDAPLRLWAHGEMDGARALATSLGYQRSRVLLQMRRSLFAALPPLTLPPGVALRAFTPGVDDAEWLALNAAAFADHPEQGAWTAADLRARTAEEWFDPSGFLLAVDEADGRMLGFHWTKVHGATDGPHAHEPIGEVYVVGVAPDQQGRGLGRQLTVAGLRHLRARGLPEAMLYVEADNAAALRTYRALGFTEWDRDVVFRRPDRDRRSSAPAGRQDASMMGASGA